MNLLIAEAHGANELATSVSSKGGVVQLALIAVVFLIYCYFTIYRPQANRAKEQQNLMATLAKGDEVLTSGGLMGRISKISADNSCLRLVLHDNLEIAIKKEFITAILPKGTLKSL